MKAPLLHECPEVGHRIVGLGLHSAKLLDKISASQSKSYFNQNMEARKSSPPGEVLVKWNL